MPSPRDAAATPTALIFFAMPFSTDADAAVSYAIPPFDAAIIFFAAMSPLMPPLSPIRYHGCHTLSLSLFRR